MWVSVRGRLQTSAVGAKTAKHLSSHTLTAWEGHLAHGRPIGPSSPGTTQCQGQSLMHHDPSRSTSSDCVAWFGLGHALSGPLSLVSYVFLNLVLKASNWFGSLPGISPSNLLPPKISSIGIYGMQQRTLVIVTQLPSVDLSGPLHKMRCLKKLNWDLTIYFMF